MSLQSDLELCLGYAERLEDLQEQQAQAQNGIVFLHSEGEQLKKSVRWRAVANVLIPAYFAVGGIWGAISGITGGDVGFFGAVIVLIIMLFVAAVAFVITSYMRRSAQKELNDLEAKKPELLRQYTAEVEKCERDIADLVDEIREEELLEIVPVDYFSVAAIEFCLSQVRKKLANTPTEVFRRLEAEIKRMEQMDQLEQMNDAQIAQLSEIKHAIDVNTMVNAINQSNNNR